MSKLRTKIRTVLLYSMITAMLVGGYPMTTFAADDSGATATVATTEPAPPPTTYTYDATTGRWNTNTWHYNATSGQYEPVVTPGPVVSNPAPAPSSLSDPVAPSTPTSSGGDTQEAASTTGNTVGNTASAVTTSGDATVNHNTSAGNATSGDATANTTVINTINSATAGDMLSFTSNVTGNVTGDMTLYPTILDTLSKTTVSPASSTSGIVVNSGTTNQVTNTISLDTATGKATVSGNTSAGSATSGAANSVVNVMNIINSMIAAQQSFVGTINIYGDLNGDILIAPDFMAQLLASNAASGEEGSSAVNSSDTQTITNNVSTQAATGKATVSGNTSAGSATSGIAATNVTILNLSGHQIMASNSLLVFVNVLGKWVGVIVDVPAGGTAAVFGSGVTQDSSAGTAATINSDTNTRLTNNITVNSRSGDAAVTRNTLAGDATSGDATSSVNILNMNQSSLGLLGWFGVLFINVFGTWLGSFGINTPYGDPPASTGSTTPGPVTATRSPQVLRFVPRVVSQPSTSSHQPVVLLASDTTPLLGDPPAAHASPVVLGTGTSKPPTPTNAFNYNSLLIAGIVGAALLIALAARRTWMILHTNAQPFIS